AILVMTWLVLAFGPGPLEPLGWLLFYLTPIVYLVSLWRWVVWMRQRHRSWPRLCWFLPLSVLGARGCWPQPGNVVVVGMLGFIGVPAVLSFVALCAWWFAVLADRETGWIRSVAAAALLLCLSVATVGIGLLGMAYLYLGTTGPSGPVMATS